MKEIVCINDDFSEECKEFFSKYNVSLPMKDKIYNVREVVQHTVNRVGFRLVEIINPRVPTSHPILGMINIEPTFNQERFALLNGMPATKESIAENVKVNAI